MLRLLVFTATYNERDNVGCLIDEISSIVPEADILVLDDSSPDGTWDIIQAKLQQNRRIKAVRRPLKLGIGSAHKYALTYAMREDYDLLLTMDADFSHRPSEIPTRRSV